MKKIIMVFLIKLKQYKKHLIPVVVSTICLYGLYLRVASRAYGKLWTDELAQLSVMEYPFMIFLKKIAQVETFPYLSGDYYLIYPFFKIFGYNKWGLAIPHLIATILGFYLLYLITKNYFKTIWGYAITFGIICFNRELIGHALEIRTYAVLPTLALGCLYFSLQLVEQNINMQLWKKWAIGTFFVLTVWFHAYGVLIFIAPLGFCLLTKWKDGFFGVIFKDVVKLVAVVLCISLPLWFWSIVKQHGPLEVVDAFQYIPNPFRDTTGFLKGIFCNLLGYKKLYFLLIGVLLPFIIPYQERFKQISLLIITIFIPIGLIALMSAINSYWFVQRQFIWTIPFFALFLGWSWEAFILYIEKKFR